MQRLSFLSWHEQIHNYKSFINLQHRLSVCAANLSQIQMKKPVPILIDFDGVIKTGNTPAPGIEEFFSFMEGNNIPAYIISNSTLRTGDEVHQFFAESGIKTTIKAMTAADAAISYVKANYKSAAVFCTESIKTLFKDIIDFDKPEAVVVGDLGEEWNYENLNKIFRYVHNGADLVAMQMNKFWAPKGNLCLDAGAFITAIEYAAGKKSVLIGKPSPIYFRSALKELGVKADSRFIMLGDDIETDILAAQQIGGKGILIYSGKTTRQAAKQSGIKPDYEADNLIEAINILQKINS